MANGSGSIDGLRETIDDAREGKWARVSLRASIIISCVFLLAWAFSLICLASYWRGRTFVSLGMGVAHYHRTLSKPPAGFGGWTVIRRPPAFPIQWWITFESGNVDLPCWMPFAAMGAITVMIRRRTRTVAGSDRCSQCGYSLRANTSGRCPECGKEFDVHAIPNRIESAKQDTANGTPGSARESPP